MDFIDAVISPINFIVALLVFGFAPGAVLRLIMLAFPRDDDRRKEILGELYAVPRAERPFWVFEQLERALCEGLPGRYRQWRAARSRGSAVGGHGEATERGDTAEAHGHVAAHGQAHGRVLTEDLTITAHAEASVVDAVTVFEPAVVKVEPARDEDTALSIRPKQG